MTVETLALFSLACLMLVITPGPDMIYVLTRSIAQGPLAGLISVVGFAVGCTIHALAAAFGLAHLFQTSPLAYSLVQYAGAAYLAWMAYQTLRSPTLPFLNTGAAPRAALWRVFQQALIGNLLNPKVVLFFIALFPQFLDPAAGSILAQTLTLVMVLNVIGGAVNGTIALLGGRFGVFMSRRPRFQKVQKYLLATVFAGLALRLAVGRSN